jgi:hypothetical protein
LFYKLKGQFILRGWERLPYAIQDRRTGRTAFLDETFFQAASFCNGLVDVDSPFIPQKHRDAINKMEEAGIIEKCAYGDQPEDYQKYRKYPCRFIRRAHWSITGKCNLRCYSLCWAGFFSVIRGAISIAFPARSMTAAHGACDILFVKAPATQCTYLRMADCFRAYR